MALIKCRNCGHMVSDKGTKCPKCGTPIHKVEEAAKPIEEKEKVIASVESQIPERQEDKPSASIVEPRDFIERAEKSPRGTSFKITIPIFISIIVIVGLVAGLYFTPNILSLFNGKEDVETKKEIILKGTIDEKIGFTMHLQLKGDKVEGTEHYDNQKSYVTLSVKGKIDENGHMILHEYDNSILCGTFEGFLKHPTYRGVFTSKSGKNMSFCADIIDEVTLEDTTEHLFKEDRRSFHLVGTITNNDNCYDFIMDLECVNNNVSGRYIVPNGYNEYVQLTGNIDNEGNIELREYNNNSITDYYFKGLFNNERITGKYINRRSGLTMTFFADVKEESTLESGVDNARQHDLEQEEVDRTKLSPSWIQGTWTYSAYGIVSRLKIHGNNITYEMDGSVQYDGTFEYRDGSLHFGSNYIDVDEYSQRLKADNTHYFTRSGSNTSYSGNSSSSDNNEELRIMTRLKELQNKGKELTDELATMRSRGQMDPMRYMYIKQNLISYKDDQISLARKLGDSQMVYEYQQQKSQIEQALRMIENGM